MREVNQAYRDLVAALGLHRSVPKGFNISSQSWLDAEAAIAEAIHEGNVILTKRLCEDYKARAMRYFRWGYDNAN